MSVEMLFFLVRVLFKKKNYLKIVTVNDNILF